QTYTREQPYRSPGLGQHVRAHVGVHLVGGIEAPDHFGAEFALDRGLDRLTHAFRISRRARAHREHRHRPLPRHAWKQHAVVDVAAIVLLQLVAHQVFDHANDGTSPRVRGLTDPDYLAQRAAIWEQVFGQGLRDDGWPALVDDDILIIDALLGRREIAPGNEPKIQRLTQMVTDVDRRIRPGTGPVDDHVAVHLRIALHGQRTGDAHHLDSGQGAQCRLHLAQPARRPWLRARRNVPRDHQVLRMTYAIRRENWHQSLLQQEQRIAGDRAGQRHLQQHQQRHQAMAQKRLDDVSHDALLRQLDLHRRRLATHAPCREDAHHQSDGERQQQQDGKCRWTEMRRIGIGHRLHAHDPQPQPSQRQRQHTTKQPEYTRLDQVLHEHLTARGTQRTTDRYVRLSTQETRRQQTGDIDQTQQ